MENNELRHHGVVGMKWGVRRTPAQLGYKTSNKKKKLFVVSKTNKTNVKKSSSESKKKTVKDMSDEELAKAIKRLQLEKQYKDLNPETVSRGKKFVNALINKTLAPAAAEAGKQLAKDYMIKKGKDLLNLNEIKDIDPTKELSEVVKKLALEKQYETLTGKKYSKKIK